MRSGKTYSAVKSILDSVKKNNPVWVNFFVDYRLGFPDYNPDLCNYFDDLSDIRYMSNGLVVIDEAHYYLSSRKWSDMSCDLHVLLSQSSKMGLDVIIVTQDIKRVDVILRELAGIVRHHFCVGGGVRKDGSPYAPLLLGYKDYLVNDYQKSDSSNVGLSFYRLDNAISSCFDSVRLIMPSCDHKKTFYPSYTCKSPDFVL